MTAPRKDKSAAHREALASQWVKHQGELKAVRTARAAVSQGAQLLLLKEASPPGTWRGQVNALGVSSDVAQRNMAVAKRFSNASDAFLDAAGSASKLFELLALKDAESLACGKEVCGLTLERLAAMDVRELRSVVRAAMGRAPSVRAPKPVRLNVEEERILRLFRQCNAPAREALFSVAGLLARP